MKQTIQGPVGIAIVVVVTIALCGFLYMTFVHEKTVTPEDTLKAMSQHGQH